MCYGTMNKLFLSYLPFALEPLITFLCEQGKEGYCAISIVYVWKGNNLEMQIQYTLSKMAHCKLMSTTILVNSLVSYPLHIYWEHIVDQCGLEEAISL